MKSVMNSTANGTEEDSLQAAPQNISMARKLGAVYTFTFHTMMAYRAQAVIWILTDAIPAVVMPLVWIASYQGRTQLGGFAPNQMVMYYLFTLMLNSFITSHVQWDIANDIREGRFSVPLVRPFPYYLYMLVTNFSWRVNRTLLAAPVFCIGLWLYRDMITFTGFTLSAGFWVTLLAGHMVSFSMVFCMGILALYFQEIRNVLDLYYIPMLFLSGSIAPVALLPHSVQAVSTYLPFRFTLSVPLEVLMGRIHGADVWLSFAAQLGWVALFGGISIVMWKRGLKHYTGVGM